KKSCIARINDAYFLEHLSYDDFDVFVVDVHTLEAIDFLNFVDEILLKLPDSADVQNLMRNNKPISQLLTLQDMVSPLYDQVLRQWNEMLFFHSSAFVAHHNNSLVFLHAAEIDNAIDFGNFCRIFWLSRFDELCNARKTSSDVFCFDCSSWKTG